MEKIKEHKGFIYSIIAGAFTVLLAFTLNQQANSKTSIEKKLANKADIEYVNKLIEFQIKQNENIQNQLNNIYNLLIKEKK